MKKYILFIFLVGFAIVFTACSPAYVAVKPNYIENPRPTQPSNRHIWVNGDWVWNSRTKTYIRRDSYWTVPNRNRNYIQGQWKTNRRGYYWSPSRWR